MEKQKKARVIAFYLPQFHPIPENDDWWGKGFTEWTNVAKAKPLFKGHYQPRIPADLGFYDLRLPEVREQQADMAREAGIEGFCYWHYWFGNGKKLLERPFNEVLESGKPNFPFCLGWANHDWTTQTWERGKTFSKNTDLIKVEYSNHDHINHFYHVLKAFKDDRYMKVDNKPIFVIYDTKRFPYVSDFISKWNLLALENGLEGIHFVGITQKISLRHLLKNKTLDTNNNAKSMIQSVLNNGFDAVNTRNFNRSQMLSKNLIDSYLDLISRKTFPDLTLKKYNYDKIIQNYFTIEDAFEKVYPTIIPNYDRTPRAGKKASIWLNSTPELFKKHVNDAINIVSEKPEDKRIIFLQSWNEWAEGNYMEPDLKYGKGYVEALKRALFDE